jgi:predicted acylesterase/phospholipase RssA
VTGAVYEIGCLRALEALTDRSMLDLDLYVGVSGGAFVSSLLAAGVSPTEMYDAVVHPRRGPFGDPAAVIFRLGLGEFWRRTVRAPRVLADAVLTALKGDRSLADAAWSLFELLPAGLLDNSGVGDYVRSVLETRGVGDRFADLRRALYVIAVDLDSGEAVAFGDEHHRDVPVSMAVQASTALPGLYRPVRVGGRDYVDGGVKKTAHINLAIRNGAGLVFCINPLVPIHNSPDGPLEGHLSNKGVTYVLDQVLRIALHGRMQYGLERYRHEHPDVDILLLEPTHDDMRMFRYNIMRYSARRIVAVHGYRSVLAAFRERRSEYRKLLARHGIRMTDPDTLPDEPGPSPIRTTTGRTLSGNLDVLRSRLRAAGE